MKKIVLAVFDIQAQTFAIPMFVPTRGYAVRAVTDEVNRAAQDNMLYLHPADFRLFELGEFDDQTGLFVLNQMPQLVTECSSLKT